MVTPCTSILQMVKTMEAKHASFLGNTSANKQVMSVIISKYKICEKK